MPWPALTWKSLHGCIFISLRWYLGGLLAYRLILILQIYFKHILNFLRNRQTVFQRGWTISHTCHTRGYCFSGSRPLCVLVCFCHCCCSNGGCSVVLWASALTPWPSHQPFLFCLLSFLSLSLPLLFCFVWHSLTTLPRLVWYLWRSSCFNTLHTRIAGRALLPQLFLFSFLKTVLKLFIVLNDMGGAYIHVCSSLMVVVISPVPWVVSAIKLYKYNAYDVMIWCVYKL